jgi:hypothetical protein
MFISVFARDNGQVANGVADDNLPSFGGLFCLERDNFISLCRESCSVRQPVQAATAATRGDYQKPDLERGSSAGVSCES